MSRKGKITVEIEKTKEELKVKRAEVLFLEKMIMRLMELDKKGNSGA